MTKGLKEDLIKRLDEAIRNEQESADLNKENAFDSVLPSEVLSEHAMTEAYVAENAQHSINISRTMTQKINEELQPQVTYEQGRSSSLVCKTTKDPLNHGRNLLNVDINEGQWSIEENFGEGEGVDGCVCAGLEGKQADQVTAKETNDLFTVNQEPVIALGREALQNAVSHNESHDSKAQLENDDLKTLHVDAKDNMSDTNNQVSEVNPVLGFQVKSDSISTESVTIIEKNELKDNEIADDVKLELDVKPEMVQPSSNNVVPECGKSHPMDVEEPHANKVSVEDTCGSNAENLDIVPKSDNEDLGCSEKSNLDRNSGDDFIEEDVMQIKHTDSKTDSDEMRTKAGKVEEPTSKDEGLVDIVGDGMPAEEKVAIVVNKNGPATQSAKRKLNDQQTVGNNDIAKRQRRWNSECLKVPESQSGDVVSTTPKDVLRPALKRNFSRSDSTVGEEVPKERVVPLSPKPPTNSLRIDHFLRPFTLKAVQELLGKTGTITNFWMDQIKTHCYVSYSSIKEAVETLHAVYNLQWPTNGGRLLVAEFVDPLEVKVRVEAPPQSPATPVSLGAGIPPVCQNVQPKPSPRPQLQKQQLPQPAIPPPLPLLNPPPAREHPASVKERLTLPPPPTRPEKTDPPIVTLDDLFRKTKAAPRIYYLPLSDEQVAAKLRARAMNGKQ
ncbi:hypothetical protein ACH5RR_013121 [Cinchona calisaya]|uniref:SAP domain-containing protein n=1 Tax=Cinchona calisaya TaxID=153742 RepID=A0ABD3A0G0_9GENT